MRHEFRNGAVLITPEGDEVLTPESLLDQAKLAASELRELRERVFELDWRKRRGRELGYRIEQASTDGKVTDVYLATLAMAYVELSQLPVKVMPTLGRLLDRSPNTIKMHLVRARDRELLTGEPGKTGGQLTDKARNILAYMEMGTFVVGRQRDD